MQEWVPSSLPVPVIDVPHCPHLNLQDLLLFPLQIMDVEVSYLLNASTLASNKQLQSSIFDLKVFVPTNDAMAIAAMQGRINFIFIKIINFDLSIFSYS